MELGEINTCGFCYGNKFNVPKEVYDRRDRILRNIRLRIIEGWPKILLRIVLDGLRQKAAQYPPCSFCKGEGYLKEKIADL